MSKSNENIIDWQAKWIWKDCNVSVNDFSYFRKEFKVYKPFSDAKAYVSAHNHFELYINSVKVSGYVTPAPTHPKKSKYYLQYDVTDQLKEGMNAFCAAVHYIGGNGQNYVNGLPGFILQCNVNYCDGSREVLISDENWKALKETPFLNGTLFQQNRKLSSIEDYDARKEEIGWLESGFDDAHWNFACISRINEEGWVMKPQEVSEGAIHEIILPKPISVQKQGLQVFDAGKIITGWPRLELRGLEGIKVRMRYSEDLDESGRVKHNVCNEKSENYYDQYTMKGSTLECWEPSFSYKAFRYVEITGYTEMVKPENIKIISAGTGLSYKGSFKSSNPLLNDIYQACIQTQKNNVTGQMVDCPHREQAQYLADSDLQAETFIYNFTDAAVIRKVLLDFKDAQYSDGRFPFVFPSNNDNPEFDIRIPEWDLHFVTLLWKAYYMYNDQEILHLCYEAAKSTVNYYLDHRSESTGLMPKAESHHEGWNISDWPCPNLDESGKYLTVQNCKLYHVTVLLSKMASLLGLDGEAEQFELEADKLKQAIVEYFYLPNNRRFIDCYPSEQVHQGPNVVAYQYGLVPENDREEVLDFIVEQGFGCETLISLNLLQVLFENGKGHIAYALLNNAKQPGWGHMIKKGFKTVWEGFIDAGSHSHAWNAYPARIFVEYIVGIKAAAPGFEEMDIRPYIPSDMLFAEGTVPTVSGDIYVRWEREEEGITVKARLPKRITARVYHPSSGVVLGVIKDKGWLSFED